MAMGKETLEQLRSCAMDLRQMGQPNDNVVRTDQLKGVHMAMTGSMPRRSRGSRGSAGGWEDPGRNFHEAFAWIGQQKRLIETASWGDDPVAIEQQLISHQKYHSSIQRSSEVDRARDELVCSKGDKASLHALEQEWDSLQKMSYGRTQQLRELREIIEEISREIMWVNDREEEELVFDWGDKKIDQYIPQKQESYSKLMSALEDKEKDLNKLKNKVDAILKNNHPASDKIEAYMDTLQTQWSWLLQITKCIDVHLKENAAYSQFFKEANETYTALQKEHETVRKKFTCDKNTALENLLDLLRELEKEKEKVMENKRQVQHLVNKSKSIVRLKPRNPEEKSSSPVIVKALCDFKQDQKVIGKGNEGILKDNSQRSKWQVMGPGGLEMLVPSVCLLIPPPNPLSISLANKNEQYFEAILSIWNQFHINIKSLIAWQYCLLDIKRINSLTITMLARMRPEEYHKIIKNLESHYEEFKLASYGSQMFVDEDKRSLENQYTGAQAHYDQLVVQLPAYTNKEQVIKREVVKVVKTEPVKKKVVVSTSHSLSELHTLRLRLEAAEDALTQHVHICLGDDGTHDCGLRIVQLETVQHDIDSIRAEYLRLKEQILKELEGMNDSDKAQFLRSEIGVINQRLGSLESSSSAYLQRLRAMRDLLESIGRAEDIVKVHEARLTEKETTSLSPAEVEEYMLALKNMKVELDLKRDVLASMEAELGKADHWNGQVCGPYHRCDMMLCKYSEQVGLLSDRWKRIQSQINTRLIDLESYLPQLQHYKQTSASLSEWITATRKRQDSLQANKIGDLQTLNEHINSQKALNTEIKGKRDTVESVLRDNETCVNFIKDHEVALASYSSGLETLLNIPIKRTMLKSPSMDLTQEATLLQTRYMELLTLSGDYYKYLGEMVKNMEQLKIRNTRIDLLEEELRLLKEDIKDHGAKNRSLEEEIARYQLELSQSQDQLLSVEEVKRNTALQCSATQESLDSTHSQLAELNDQVARLNYLIEEEKRKKRLAEERYSQQQQEYETVLRKRQKELEGVNWAKMEVEKSIVDREREVEQLRRQLAEEVSRNKELQLEMTKVRSKCFEKNISRLQGRIKDLQVVRDGLESQVENLRKTNQEELTRRKRVETELEQITKTMREYSSTITTLRHSQEQANASKKRGEDEKHRLQEDLERSMRQNKASAERLTQLSSELKALQQQLLQDREPQTLDPSTLVFDGVRKPVTAEQLHDCGVLDKPIFNQLVSVDKKVSLKGTGPIAGVVVEGLKGLTSISGPQCKMSLTEAKKKNLLSPDSADLLLDAQAATGHIIDPITNQKLTVEEACNQGVVDEADRERLLAAEAATVGYRATGKPLSVFQAMKKGLTDKNTALRLLQAQESVGGILDPTLSVFLPKDTAMQRDLIDEDMCRALNQRPELYLDPESEQGVTYVSMKRRCKTEPHTGLLLLPVPEKLDPSKLVFDGVRKPVTAKQLLDCSVLDKPTFNQLEKGDKTVPEVSVDKKVSLKGTGPVAGVLVEGLKGTGSISGPQCKMSLTEAKKKNLLSSDSADLLLDAQAATGHIIDPTTNQKLTVQEACNQGVVDEADRERLLAAEAAAVGYCDRVTGKTLSVFQAMKKGLIDKNTALRLLQAQESVGGILDPTLSVFLPKDTAMQRDLIDEDMCHALKQRPELYLDPENEDSITYLSVKRRCKTEPHTGLLLLPVPEKIDSSKLVFDGVRKPVTAKQLLDCGVLDKPTLNQLEKGEKTGTGPIAGVLVEGLKGPGSISGRQCKMSLTEAKKKNLL
uniref:Desmoplakin b n=1 Tax=Myripristis murdjan TaxID=586833 RepID=A0A667YQM4_9TELE